jgi:hypothetical protein
MMDKVRGPTEELLPPQPTEDPCSPSPGLGPAKALVRELGKELDLAMGRPERVVALCEGLAQELELATGLQDAADYLCLLPALRVQSPARLAPIFSLLARVAAVASDPWLLLEGMLAARDSNFVLRSLDVTFARLSTGSPEVRRRVALFLADQVESEGSPLADPTALEKIAYILRLLPVPDAGVPNPIVAVYLTESDGKLRRLAARVLDLSGQSVAAGLIERVLGTDSYRFLLPYLEFTRATHVDLLCITPTAGEAAAALQALRRAEAICGRTLLREVIAELGWARLNRGFEVRPYVGIGVGGSLPLLLQPCEAPIFEGCEGARRVFELYLFIAQGGLPEGNPTGSSDMDLVGRFRRYNLTHAEALADILDVAPLTREKVERILLRMDRIVEDFVVLFSSQGEEAAILPGIYGALKQRIISELEKESSHRELSVELTRLVQMFEDPPSLGSVRTLHGLKRYLHQRGLRLGMRLVQPGRSANRTVDVVVASRKRILRTMKAIRFVDFEPEEADEADPTSVPYPVAALVEALSRQLIHGQETFPNIKVFCYGNEVHYYLSFRNHPAFLRIDYSPPLQGGMIDLEYYGISQYELSVHPNTSLDFIQLFFRRLEFDVQVDSTRIHARYDKERALDLQDICERAEALFALIPYLMEVDWIIGGLTLDAEARREVARCWSERFALWHTLPVAQLLTKDRQAILSGLESGPAGERELAWRGESPYRDRFAVSLPAEFVARLRTAVDDLGLEVVIPREEEGCRPMGPVRLGRCLLGPLREAATRGELVVSPGGLERCSPDLFQREHEAEKFAAVLDSPDEVLSSACRLTRLVAPLERFLHFRTTGNLNGYEVQRARLPLRGKCLGLYVLRDQAGIARLALFTRGEGLWRRRRTIEADWESNCCSDAAAFGRLLRRANWSGAGAVNSTGSDALDVRQIRRIFRSEIDTRQSPPQHGERIVTGLKASPGRAVGIALFGTNGRSPRDFDGAVLVAPVVRPEDNTFLYHSVGIVSTGGGVLSHAGLMAAQFRKPALIISGQWQKRAGASPVLIYRVLEFQEERLETCGWEITMRRRMREQEYEMREGDLLVIDANEGALRVLGQGIVTLALHESFQLFSETSRRLARATDPKEILFLRGWRLHARHQIEKLFAKLTDPILARHAIHEILLGRLVADMAAGRGERSQLLSLILGNRLLGSVVKEYLLHIAGGLAHRYRRVYGRAETRVPTSNSLLEILALRLEVMRLWQSLRETSLALKECGLEDPVPAGINPAAALDLLVRRRLIELRAALEQTIDRLPSSASRTFRLHQALRQIERIDLVLGERRQTALLRVGEGLSAELTNGSKTRSGPSGARFVLGPEECGFDLYRLTGWKAANLAEVDRIGHGTLVPQWFVVTHTAFEEMLNQSPDKAAWGRSGVPQNATSLREAIEGIIARHDLDNAQKSGQIRELWEGVSIPEEIADEIGAAYRGLAGSSCGSAGSENDPSQPFVAIRSSAREEDAEVAARAGEFETFLFVHGEKALLDHLKRAWSGLWTERALHNRSVLGSSPTDTGGGVIVQRIVWSRVSGVLQTINVAEGEMREMVINAGLGLGEGIVSGVVAADQIVVDREANLDIGPLRFRYATADKRERMVFDKRLGMGTAREETLYHQRLRPALEYVELADLVRTAASLEEAYGYALDIEFGLEGTRLWILQSRPVATYLSVLSETLEHRPLAP